MSRCVQSSEFHPKFLKEFTHPWGRDVDIPRVNFPWLMRGRLPFLCRISHGEFSFIGCHKSWSVCNKIWVTVSGHFWEKFGWEIFQIGGPKGNWKHPPKLGFFPLIDNFSPKTSRHAKIKWTEFKNYFCYGKINKQLNF